MISSKPFSLNLQFRGFVEGLTYLDESSKPQCHYFGGIPYALPPVGPFRFQKPRSLPQCYRYGTRANAGRYIGGCGLCPQANRGGFDPNAWDEDCLQSNIWIPAGKAPEGGWPVFFYIHGGFLQWGGPNTLNMRKMLAESPTKCIIVTPAYRLNIFGFLASTEFSASCPDFSANLGFWDQRLALQWTHENISYFGGNASNISIAGYSAGSHSVFHQLAYDLNLPDNKAVVKRALMLSNGPGPQPKSVEEAQHQCDELLTYLKIPLSLSPAEKLAKLRAVSATRLIEGSQKIHLHQFRAVTDDSFVRSGLLEEINNGVFARALLRRGLKLMIGECSDEHNVYGTWRPLRTSGAKNLRGRLEADYPMAVCDVLMSHYVPDGKLPRQYKSWGALFGHIYADVQVHSLERGMVKALVAHGAGQLIHRYRIEFRMESVDDIHPPEFGVSHASDVPIWFWGDGKRMSEKEKGIILRAFHDPLSRFLNGDEAQWGTESPLQIRVLKSDGRVQVEEDTRMEEGLRLWEALKKVGATGDAREIARL